MHLPEFNARPMPEARSLISLEKVNAQLLTSKQ